MLDGSARRPHLDQLDRVVVPQNADVAGDVVQRLLRVVGEFLGAQGLRGF
ncbi:MAG: hypothetical protein ACM3Q9_01805 [Methanosarcina sp.]